jgi:NADPH:quinone reductase-like Zn-dependent oxidoreductase
MAERAAVPHAMCVPLPASLDDATAAALFNPGMSAWLALKWRAQLAKGETVLILGATGAAGQMAIQIARLSGASKIIALGRNPQILNTLQGLGADTVLSLEQSDEELVKAIARAVGDTGVDVIIDFLWGHPTEVVVEAITRKGLTHVAPRVRLVEVGSMGGPTITLPAAVLRSSGLEIYGSGAGTVPVERMIEAMPQFIAQAASGNLKIASEEVALADVANAWEHLSRENRRIVFKP